MSNENPAEMSNADLEKDMEQRNLETPKGNQEKLNKSTAAEGTLLTPDQDPFSKSNLRKTSNQSDDPQLTSDEDSQDGSGPDPEAMSNWENNDDDLSHISS